MPIDTYFLIFYLFEVRMSVSVSRKILKVMNAVIDEGFHQLLNRRDPINIDADPECRNVIDRMITLGKRGDLHARRQALSVIRSKDVTAKLFGELAERFKDRPGGYTRIMKIGHRPGDAAPMSIIELVDSGRD